MSNSLKIPNGLTINDILRLAKVATGNLPAANSSNEGAIVYDDTTNTFKYSNGSAWVEAGGGGGGSITGSGVANQIVYWSGAAAVAGDTGLTFNTSTNVLTVTGGVAFGDGTTQTTAADVAYSWQTNALTAETTGRNFFVSHSLVKLGDGRFFVVGGTGAGASTSEIINATATASAASGVPTQVRSTGTRAVLLNNGTVLVAGGNGSPTTSETWNPGTGLFTARGAISYSTSSGIAALDNGNALLFGGRDGSSDPVDTSQLYDAVAGTWSATASMTIPRAAFGKAVRVAGGTIGKIFVAGGTTTGGDQVNSAEMFDGDTGLWTTKSSMIEERGDAGVVVLLDGTVMFIGGINNFGNTTLGSVEIYNPVDDMWSAVGSLNRARSGTHAVLLPDGKVVCAGGTGGGDWDILPTEMYDPATEEWTICADGISFTAPGTNPKHNVSGADLALLNGVTGLNSIIAVGGVTPTGVNYLRNIRQLKPISFTALLASKTMKDFVDAQGATPFIWGTHFNTSMTPGKRWIIQSPDPGYSPLLQIFADTAATSGSSITGFDGGVVLGGGAVNVMGQLFVNNVIHGDTLQASGAFGIYVSGNAPDSASEVGVILDNVTELTNITTKTISFRSGNVEKSYIDYLGSFVGPTANVDGVNLTNSPDITTQLEPYVVRVAKSYRNSGQTISDASTDQVAFDALAFDKWNLNASSVAKGFDGGTAAYVAPFQGYYQVDVILTFTNIANIATNYVIANVNVSGGGVQLTTSEKFATTSGPHTVTLSGIVYCANAEDAIDVTVNPNGGQVDVQGWFSVKHLGHSV